MELMPHAEQSRDFWVDLPNLGAVERRDHLQGQLATVVKVNVTVTDARACLKLIFKDRCRCSIGSSLFPFFSPPVFNLLHVQTPAAFMGQIQKCCGSVMLPVRFQSNCKTTGAFATEVPLIRNAVYFCCASS